MSGQHLCAGDQAIAGRQDDVGKGAADIDGEANDGGGQWTGLNEW